MEDIPNWVLNSTDLRCHFSNLPDVGSLVNIRF